MKDTKARDEMELTAIRAGGLLQHILSTDEDASSEIRKIFRHLAELQEQSREWAVMHHLLHKVLTAFSPFYNSLHILQDAGTNSEDWRVLLKNWHLCQVQVDQLMNFESSTAHSTNHSGWALRLAILQREMENGLRDEAYNIKGLVDLADDFRQTCDIYLGVADRELRQTVEDMQHLHTQLTGGWL